MARNDNGQSPWDDSALIRAFESAMGKYEVMHNLPRSTKGISSAKSQEATQVANASDEASDIAGEDTEAASEMAPADEGTEAEAVTFTGASLPTEPPPALPDLPVSSPPPSSAVPGTEEAVEVTGRGIRTEEALTGPGPDVTVADAGDSFSQRVEPSGTMPGASSGADAGPVPQHWSQAGYSERQAAAGESGQATWQQDTAQHMPAGVPPGGNYAAPYGYWNGTAGPPGPTQWPTPGASYQASLWYPGWGSEYPSGLPDGQGQSPPLNSRAFGADTAKETLGSSAAPTQGGFGQALPPPHQQGWHMHAPHCPHHPQWSGQFPPPYPSSYPSPLAWGQAPPSQHSYFPGFYNPQLPYVPGHYSAPYHVDRRTPVTPHSPPLPSACPPTTPPLPLETPPGAALQKTVQGHKESTEEPALPAQQVAHSAALHVGDQLSGAGSDGGLAEALHAWYYAGFLTAKYLQGRP